MAKLKDTTVTGTLSVSGNISSGSLGTHMKSDSLEIYSATTPYIDFHAGGTTSDYSHRILAQSDGKLVITASTLSTSGALAVTGNITTSGSLTVGNIPATLKNLCSNGAGNSAPGYVLGFNTDYLSSGYTSVANLRNTMGAPLMVSDGNYYTLAAPSGAAIAWLRTPTSGLIPYASGGVSSNLGSSTWPFNITYTNRVISKNFQTGSFTMATTAEAVSSATVTFAETMTGTPRPMAIASSSVPNTVREITVDTVSSTGFKCYEYRTNGTDNTVYWIAYYR